MKHTQKIVGLMLAVVMVLSLATVALAADITVNGTAGSYEGYKLLNLTTDEGETNYSYTVNAKYSAILKTAAGNADMSDAALITYLEGMTAEATRTYADAVYRAIVAAGLAVDATAVENTFADVEQGYWLIVDVTDNQGEYDANSLVMLDTAGRSEVTVTPKKDVPEVEKKVQEDTTAAWQDAADYDIGDAVPFKLTGTTANYKASYETYKYVFHDTMSAGLTFNNDVVVTVDGAVLDAASYTVLTAATEPAVSEDGCTFEVVINDLKTATSAGAVIALTDASEVVVTYTAELNENAVIAATGNPNSVTLEYGNNPYGTSTGETPEDLVTVFTFDLDVNKVDNTGAALAGAGFTLSKWDETANEGAGAYVAIGAEVIGEGMTTFEFRGLDSGRYQLTETTVPDGYNQIDPIEFVIESTYDTESADPQLTALVVEDLEGTVLTNFTITLTPTEEQHNIVTNIVNLSGQELPSTGGIGTTIFYVIGGILVAAAVVVLTTKKRMANNA